MSFLASGLATQDRRFLARIQACLYKLAMDVLFEDPATEDHNARIALAENITSQSGALNSAAYRHLDFVWACVTNPSIAASITLTGDQVDVTAPDSDIEFVCASNYTRIAKIRANN